MTRLLATLAVALCSCCEHEPDPRARDAWVSVASVLPDGTWRRCTGAAIGPTTVATAAHCLRADQPILADGEPAELDVCDHARDVCWLRVAERDTWVPACSSWPAGAEGTSVHHEAAELTAVCLDLEPGGSHCARGLRKGSSGAPVVANGCVAGVLVLHWPSRPGRPARWTPVQR